jgi:hypothetical protein
MTEPFHSRNSQRININGILLTTVILLFLLALIPSPVQAVRMEALQVPQYSFDAPEGNVIYQILIDSVPMGTNQTHTLTVGSATYLLDIKSSNPYGIYYDFDIAWTLPNGTTQTIRKSITRLPGAGYKTVIQPVYMQLESAYFVLMTVDLEIGTTNQSVTAGLNTNPQGWNPSEAIPFTSAAGTFGGTPTNVYLYSMSAADFVAHVQTYDPVYGLANLGSTVFQWAWSAVLGFINQIPIVGPQFVSLILIMGAIIQEILIWLTWIISNIPLVLAALEITIMMLAVVMAGNKPTPARVARNIFRYNVSVAQGFLWCFTLIYTWAREFILLIAGVVNALKPL